MERHYLWSLFDPGAIAVLHDEAGAGMGERLRAQILDSGFVGTVIDLRVGDEPDAPEGARCDLALLAVGPARVEPAIDIAARLRARSAVVLPVPATGAGAPPPPLRALERRYGLNVLGPNALGLQRPHLKLIAGLAGAPARPGTLALVSQSGALTAAVLDWAQDAGVGFSAVVTIGAGSGVGLAQVLDFLASDAHTQSVVAYIEGIRDGAAFMSALRAAASAKPVIVLKAGRRQAGTRAALTHSGAMVGSDDVFDAALARAGAVRVGTFTELFSAAKCLAARYRPFGSRIAVVTNGGGPGVLAADQAAALGLRLEPPAAAARGRLEALRPPPASLDNPVDLTEEAGPSHYVEAIRALCADADVDGVLAVYAPKHGADPDEAARAVAEAGAAAGKPVVACWLGGHRVQASRRLLDAAAVPSFRTPEAAIGAFSNIATFYRNQQLLQQTPPPIADHRAPDVRGARILVETVLAERRATLTEMESKALLSAFHVPVTQTHVARTATEAILVAEQIGFPVAMKINSPDATHKSDVGGVVLDVREAAQVRDVFAEMLASVRREHPELRLDGITVQSMRKRAFGREVYVGVVSDPLFGPVIAFGAGGTMIELIRDRAMELPPLNAFLARRLIERARVASILGPWRGAAAADVGALESILLRVSEIVCELPWVREMDINPILVDDTGAVAVDARIVVGEARPGGRGRYAHLTLKPYPADVVHDVPLPDGTHYGIRAIRPDDGERLQTFVRGLSDEARYYRFVATLKELPPQMLARYTLIDYDRAMALVAAVRPPGGEVAAAEQIIGVARYVVNPDGESCEFALVVGDPWQGRGIGARLMEELIAVAERQGLTRMEGYVLRANTRMLRSMERIGFSVQRDPEDPDMRRVVRPLGA